MSKPNPRPLAMREVFTNWWPLAASWLLMGLELPAVSAVMARLPEATVSLAAYGGVVFPLALLIEAPIVMFLAASTALCRDWESYRLVRRMMLWMAGSLTALHVLVAFTPLFDLVVVRWIGVPDVIREPARLGLQVLTPWTFSIAYRRTQQGVLIRFGHARAIGIGTAIRLVTNVVVLGLGYVLGRWPGIVVGTAAVAAGVMAEALYAARVVHPVLRDQVRAAPPAPDPLTTARFLRFYLPLAVTPVIVFMAMPIMSAAMSRMPLVLESLAVWPVLSGLVFTARSVGFAYNEVVVALLDRPRPVPALTRFARLLAGATSLGLLLVAATPLGALWFGRASALPDALVPLATTGLWIGLLLPALAAYHSLYQGALVHSHRTRAITESVVIMLATSVLVLWASLAWTALPGLYVASAALLLSNAAMVAWMWLRGRSALAAVSLRDADRVVPLPAVAS
jgi:hypothetical protein